MTVTDTEAVVEHVTHAAAQRAFRVRTVDHGDNLVVHVKGQITRHALAAIVTQEPYIQAIYEEVDGALTEELTGTSRLKPNVSVTLTGPYTPFK